jgi:hypothetical protein
MEENKDKKGCEHGSCENCKDKKEGFCCHHHCHRRGLVRILLLIILIAVAVHIGIAIGTHGFWGFGERGNYRPMMNYNYSLGTDLNSNAGSVTVKVLPPTTTNGTTTTPPVTQ